MPEISKTLEERGKRYGHFSDYAYTCEQILKEMDLANNSTLTPIHKQALFMIVSKISRILCGDPNYTDNWHDIAGYATLVEEELIKESNNNE